MDKGQVGIIIFVAMALLSAILFHYKKDSFWISSILSAVVAAVLFQLACFFDLGYLDPFFIIAFMFCLAEAFMLSVAVGVPFVIIRKKRKGVR